MSVEISLENIKVALKGLSPVIVFIISHLCGTYFHFGAQVGVFIVLLFSFGGNADEKTDFEENSNFVYSCYAAVILLGLVSGNILYHVFPSGTTDMAEKLARIYFGLLR